MKYNEFLPFCLYLKLYLNRDLLKTCVCGVHSHICSFHYDEMVTMLIYYVCDVIQ